ncbi:MAG: thiamine pyrophosphate-dependent dehydrogenase E1 component subunit alpha, partial [Flavobacteriales bacterium]
MSQSVQHTSAMQTDNDFRKTLIEDYRLACISREASLLGRKEVLTGKAKFGIFGDGKEVAQIALAKQFRHGDWRSGYYRDQTLMMAIDQLTVQQYFAALYAHTDVEHEPASGGRQMGGHYATRTINEDGSWRELTALKNSSADISPTGGQMPRLLGLAQASKVFRHNAELNQWTSFSHAGNEVAFGTIGDASTSEGLFWESMNAAAVLGVPMCMSVWDDGWGISVPKKFQTVKESISEALKGFQWKEGTNGVRIFKAKGWNYPELVLVYEEAVAFCREHHIPVLIHVEEVTQPQGHSTSGSHERYKSKELLEWYEEFDCIVQLKKFITLEGAADEAELDQIREDAKAYVRQEQKKAWEAFRNDLEHDVQVASELLEVVSASSEQGEVILASARQLRASKDTIRKDIVSAVKQALRLNAHNDHEAVASLHAWFTGFERKC